VLKLLEKELVGDAIVLLMEMGSDDEWLEDGDVPGDVSKCILVVELILQSRTAVWGTRYVYIDFPVTEKTSQASVALGRARRYVDVSVYRTAGSGTRQWETGRGNYDGGLASDDGNPQYGRPTGWLAEKIMFKLQQEFSDAEGSRGMREDK
jgi:hypothetical protein